MKNTRNSRKTVLTTILLMMLVAVISVGGTIAWLTDSTTEVKNTFSPSTISIELKEHDYVPGTNTLNNAEEVQTNNDYDMVPGLDLPKDPFVRVKANSEPCYVFVEVVESDNLASFISYDVHKDWVPLKDNEIQVTGPNGGKVFMYKGKVAASTENQTLTGILDGNKVTVINTVTKKDMDDLTDATEPTLSFYAYAIQSEYLTVTDNVAIWNLAKTAN